MIEVSIILLILGVIGLTCGVLGLRYTLRKLWWPCVIWFVLTVLFLVLPVICQLEGMRIGRARTVGSGHDRVQSNTLDDETLEFTSQ
jgi:hypothetical protein